jgi:hypothetical protein
MLIPALTIRPVPAQRRLPIMTWSSPTIESTRGSDATPAGKAVDWAVVVGVVVAIVLIR